MKQDLKERTYKFGLDLILLLKENPPPSWAWTITRQLPRCAASVGANYNSSKRGRSAREFISKLGVCEEEADESIHWLRLVRDSGYLTHEQVAPLIDEASELVAIFVASIKTARKNLPPSK